MKRQRQLMYDQGLAYFVTTRLTGSVDILRSPKYAHVLLSHLNRSRAKYDFELLAYVIMPDHIHLAVRPGPKGNISVIMRELKKFSAREIIGQLEQDERHDVLRIFRRSASKYHRTESRTYQVWADRFDDVAVKSEQVLQTKIAYIHHNPVRAGLVDRAEDYVYSSARDYASAESMGAGQVTDLTPTDLE